MLRQGSRWQLGFGNRSCEAHYMPYTRALSNQPAVRLCVLHGTQCKNGDVLNCANAFDAGERHTCMHMWSAIHACTCGVLYMHAHVECHRLTYP